MKNPDHEWHDILLHTGSVRFHYRIQWSHKTGKVRVQEENSDKWITSKKGVTHAKFAETVGYELLK